MSISIGLLVAGVIVIVGVAIRIIYQINKERDSFNHFYSEFELVNKKISREENEFDIYDILQESKHPIMQRWLQMGEKFMEANLQLPYKEMFEKLESQFIKMDGRIRGKINSLTVIGLIFTFLGLTITVMSSNQILEQLSSANQAKTEKQIFRDNSTGDEDVINFGSFLQQLSKPLDGMTFAFVTSLFGLVFSLFLSSWFVRFASLRDEKLMLVFDFLQLHVVTYFAPSTTVSKIDKAIKGFERNINNMAIEYENQIKSVSEITREVFEDALNKSREGFDDVTVRFQEVVDSFLEDYKVFAGTIEKSNVSSENLIKAAQLFNEHSSNFTKLSKPLENIDRSYEKLYSDLDRFFGSLEILSKSESETEQIFLNMDKKIFAISEHFVDLNILFKTSIDKGDGVSSSISDMAKELSGISKISALVAGEKIGEIQKCLYRMDSELNGLVNSMQKHHEKEASEDVNKIPELILKLTETNQQLSILAKSINRNYVSRASASFNFLKNIFSRKSNN